MTPFDETSGPPYRDEHAFVRENLPAFVAGGLAPPDRAAVDSHIAECPACAASLAELEGMDASLRQIFSPVAATAAGLEDRLISHIRENTVTPRLKTLWIRRAGMGIAAAIALGATGALADYAVKNDLLAAAKSLPDRMMAAANMDWVFKAKAPGATKYSDKVEPWQKQAIAATTEAAREGDKWADSSGSMQADKKTADDDFGFGWSLGSGTDLTGIASGRQVHGTFATGVPGSLEGTLAGEAVLGRRSVVRSYAKEDITKSRGEMDGTPESRVQSGTSIRAGNGKLDLSNNDSLVLWELTNGSTAVTSGNGSWGTSGLSTPSVDTDLNYAKSLALGGDVKKGGYAGSGQYFQMRLEPSTETQRYRVNLKDTDRVAATADQWASADALSSVKSVDTNGNKTVGGLVLKTTEGAYSLGTVTTSGTLDNGVGVASLRSQGTSGPTNAKLTIQESPTTNEQDRRTALLFRDADTFLQQQQYSEAASTLKQILVKDPNNNAAKLALRVTEDTAAFRKFEELNQRQGQEFLGKAVVALNNNQIGRTPSADASASWSTAADASTNWNSAIHGGDGQNVGFSDGHVDGIRRPDAAGNGTLTNNRYSAGSAGAFDTTMVPARSRPGDGTPATVLNGGTSGSDPAKLVPYSDLLVYPEDWVDISRYRNARGQQPETKLDPNAERAAKEYVAAHMAAKEAWWKLNANGPSPLIADMSPTATAPATQTAPVRQLTAAQVAARKIIRNGVVEYEVRSFDDAQLTVSKIVEEEGGFVAATNSERLPNGKMKGIMTVRLPPERLDRLVLKLRGIGELKGQQIGSSDITKAYTDMESRLRALRVMEERMLEIIKTGKGDVKQLVEAETRLNETRIQIEQIEGEKRYYDNQIAMATLTISAFEKDIRQPVAAVETEKLDMGIETDDVEARYIAARKAVEQAKGRIISSGLQRLDGDQLNAKIECRVPQDDTGPLVDQLRQLGRVARYTRDKRLTTDPNSTATAPKTEVQDTTLTISLFNLATTPPRETTYMTVAVPDVHEVYRKLLDAVRADVQADPATKRVSPAGKVINSGISGQRAEQMSATMLLYVRTSEFPKIMELIRSAGGTGTEVLASNIVVSADVSGTTVEKRGIQLSLQASAAVLPRDTYNLTVASTNVRALREQIKALDSTGKIRLVADTFAEPNARDVTASMTIQVPEDDKAAVEGLFQGANVAETSRSINRSDDGNRTARKLAYQVVITSADALPAVRGTAITVEVPNVRTAMDTLRGASSKAGGRETDSRVERFDNGAEVGQLTLQLPISARVDLAESAKAMGEIKRSNVTKAPNVTETPLSREQVTVTFVSRAPVVPAPIVPEGKGIDATVRGSLASAVMGLLASLYLLIAGVLFLGPWLLVAWIVWRVIKRKKPAVAVVPPAPKS